MNVERKVEKINRKMLTMTIPIVLANCNFTEEILISVCSLRRNIDSVLHTRTCIILSIFVLAHVIKTRFITKANIKLRVGDNYTNRIILR